MPRTSRRRVVKKIPKGKGKPPVKVIKKRRDLKKKARQRFLDGDMTDKEWNAYVKKVSAGIGTQVKPRKPKPKRKPPKTTVNLKKVVRKVRKRKKEQKRQAG